MIRGDDQPHQPLIISKKNIHYYETQSRNEAIYIYIEYAARIEHIYIYIYIYPRACMAFLTAQCRVARFHRKMKRRDGERRWGQGESAFFEGKAWFP